MYEAKYGLLLSMLYGPETLSAHRTRPDLISDTTGCVETHNRRGGTSVLEIDACHVPQCRCLATYR